MRERTMDSHLILTLDNNNNNNISVESFILSPTDANKNSALRDLNFSNFLRTEESQNFHILEYVLLSVFPSSLLASVRGQNCLASFASELQSSETRPRSTLVFSIAARHQLHVYGGLSAAIITRKRERERGGGREGE